MFFFQLREERSVIDNDIFVSPCRDLPDVGPRLNFYETFNHDSMELLLEDLVNPDSAQDTGHHVSLFLFHALVLLAKQLGAHIDQLVV